MSYLNDMNARMIAIIGTISAIVSILVVFSFTQIRMAPLFTGCAVIIDGGVVVNVLAMSKYNALVMTKEGEQFSLPSAYLKPAADYCSHSLGE